MVAARTPTPVFAAVFLVVLAPPVRGQSVDLSVVSTDVDPDASVTPDEGGDVEAGSADGRYAALLTDTPDFLAGQVGPVPGFRQLYLVDTVTGAKWMVSHKAGAPTTACNAPTDAALVSRDGDWVAFVSRCTDLVPGQIDPGISVDFDVFLWGRASNSSVLVSHAAGAPATVANDPAHFPNLSDDGRFVGFASSATNLVAGQTDTNNLDDVFLFDQTTGENRLVSHSIAGSTFAANGSSGTVGLSDGAAWVLFGSSASNLVAGFDDNDGGGGDLFLFERATGAVTLVTHIPANDAATGNGFVYDGTIDGAGEGVAFSSLGTDYVPGMVDGNGPLSTDVFHWSRSSDTFELLSANALGTASGNDRSVEARINLSGDHVAFLSEATNLVAGPDGNGGEDVFLNDLAGGGPTLVSHAAGSPFEAADRNSTEVSISASGDFVLFRSTAFDLVAGQVGNNTSQAFLFDRLSGESTLMSHALGAPATSGNAGVRRAVLAEASGGVLFDGDASNLVAGDLNGRRDVFASRLALFADGFESGDTSQWSNSVP